MSFDTTIRNVLGAALLASACALLPAMPVAAQPQQHQHSETGSFGRAAAGLREFEASQKVAPNRYRSVAGAAMAAERSGDAEAARRWYGRLLELTVEADTERPEMAAARQFLARN